MFCLTGGPSETEVSTRREPVGGFVLNWKPLVAIMSTGVAASCVWARCEMRARSESEESGSLESSACVCGGVLSEVLAVAGVPDDESSVWMKQQRFPYGHEPDTQKVCNQPD